MYGGMTLNIFGKYGSYDKVLFSFYVAFENNKLSSFQTKNKQPSLIIKAPFLTETLTFV